MSADFLSNMVQSVRPSATIGISQLAREKKARGDDVIILSQGEPDFDTPAHICDAAEKAIRDGKTRYTAADGIPELKEAIRAKFSRDNGLDYSSAEINVSPGGKAVIFNAFLATLNPGDEVIIPAPCWVSYMEMTRLCGGNPVIVPCRADADFKLSPEQLEAAITPRSKWLVLNSPSNPTGAVYSAAELKALGEVLKTHPQLWVLTDDIYEHLVYAGKFATLAVVVPELKSRILTMNGVSKAYAMTGWRIGFAGGPEPLISAMRKIMTQSTSNSSSVSQWAAVTALNGPQDFLENWRNVFQERRDLICRALNGADGIKCTPPPGAFYVFADCREALKKRDQTDLKFCEDLLEATGVALVPGTAFHLPGFFRLSFASDTDVLRDAADRICDFV